MVAPLRERVFDNLSIVFSSALFEGIMRMVRLIYEGSLETVLTWIAGFSARSASRYRCMGFIGSQSSTTMILPRYKIRHGKHPTE